MLIRENIVMREYENLVVWFPRLEERQVVLSKKKAIHQHTIFPLFPRTRG
jgi:hypothetical protein